MGNFCNNCGAATGGGKFCPRCGNPQAAGTPPPEVYPPQPQTTYASGKRGSPVLKIVLITLAVLLLLGVIGAVRAFFYVREKVHEQVAQIKAGGGNLRDAISGAANAQPTQAGCELLSKDRVAAILGSPVARIEGNEAGDAREYCNYWSETGTARDDSEQIYRSKRDAPDLKDLDRLIKSITTSHSGTGALLSVNVFRGNGKLAIYGVKTAAFLSGHSAHNLDGPWDEAYFGPSDAVLAVRKGNNAILLDLSKVMEKHEKGMELSKALIEAL